MKSKSTSQNRFTEKERLTKGMLGAGLIGFNIPMLFILVSAIQPPIIGVLACAASLVGACVLVAHAVRGQ